MGGPPPWVAVLMNADKWRGGAGGPRTCAGPFKPLCGHSCGHDEVRVQSTAAMQLKNMVGAAGLEPATSCV